MKNYAKFFKNRFILLIITIISVFIFSGCEKQENNTETNSIEVNRTNFEISNNLIVQNTVTSENNTTSEIPDKANTNSSTSNTNKVISKYSTKIYSKDKNRQNNLEITANALNGTVVQPNETFSFTKTIGPANKSKGYEKADIFDSNGNKIKGYGGGNCQISSTLYNAVLKAPSLKVVERHEHSNKVPYVAENKDAAVAYGSVDFKFKNENDYSIKILVQASKKYVVVTLVKI